MFSSVLLTNNKFIIENTIFSLFDFSRYIFLYFHMIEYKEALNIRTCADNFWSQNLLRVIKKSISFSKTILILTMLQQIDQMYKFYSQALNHKADSDDKNVMYDFHFMLQNEFNRKCIFVFKITIASVFAIHNRYNQRICVNEKICISNFRSVLDQKFNNIDCESSNNNNEFLSRYWNIRLFRQLIHQKIYDEIRQEMKS